MKLEVGFGTYSQTVDIPDKNLMGILTPSPFNTSSTQEEIVSAALNATIGTPRLGNLVKPGETVAIITSDITRPLQSAQILPLLLEELWRAGVRAKDVTIVFALGSHRKQTTAEMKALVGEAVYNQVRCIDGDPQDYVHLGITKLGTPVDITRIVAQADRRIAIGNIEYHYFAGYSGGAKAIMPGVSTRAAIQNNHSRMVLPEAAAGQLENNPVRKDIEEAVEFCPLDFILNVVLDEHKKIIYAAAGHYIKAHREGCRFLDRIYQKKIPAKADIVIASQGGAPKDASLYQTQKALENAKYAVKKGGIIILVGSCQEGLGDKVFEKWMIEAKTSHSMIERIGKNFELGGHKAAAIALVLEEAQVYLVSIMAEDLVKQIFLTPFSTVQSALDAAFKQCGAQATVLAMPFGGSTLPVL